ncbi:MAG: hypothetical protein ACFCGT_16035 [Sandaracinaceae bacterium]
MKRDVIHDDFTWTNFDDEDDVLGWPLGPLSEEYAALVDDVEVNVGGILFSWNPLSHTHYWESRTVVRKVVSELQALL